MNTPAASKNKTVKRSPASQAAEEVKVLAKKEPIRTLLVASCGWPTEAALPARKNTTARR